MAAYDPRLWGARCDLCPLRTVQRAVIIPPKFSNVAAGAIHPLVFVGDAPGAGDVKRGELFAGAAGVKLDEILWNQGIRRSEVALVTSALLCRPEVPNAEGRKRYELKNWLAWWRKENVSRRRAAKDFANAYPGTPLAESVREVANPFECCAPRLKAEIASVEAMAQSRQLETVVMPMGNFALGLLHGKPGRSMSVMKYRGSVITEEHIRERSDE